MLDPAYVRDRVDDVGSGLRARGLGDDAVRQLLEGITALEATRKKIIPEHEGLKREQNAAGEEIARAKRQGQDTTAIQDANKQRAARIKELAAELEAIEQQRATVLLTVPNLPHASVPVGRSAADNVEIKRCGTPRTFDFPPLAHWDLGPALGILDFERGTKLAGARFTVLNGAGARLSRALINFMLDLHTREHGYRELAPPYMANTATLTSTGHLPKFGADLFKIGGDSDLYLIPTAEVPLTGLHRDEILDGRQLPLHYVAYTPCFRSEAGSYGKDVRGMFRQHQFDKVELVKLTTPDTSYDALEQLTTNAETVLERLGLPYRRMLLCTGDMGFAAAKTYDVEVWLPSRGDYAEISSCSNTEAFQARRANIKFRPGGAGSGKSEFVHTLNGSGLAIGRTLIALLENYQEKDGTVTVPPVLRPYLDGLDRITQ